MPGLIKKPKQTEKILEALRFAKVNNNGWVSGRYFLQTLLLSQYHARIFELERKGYVIERGSKDEYGFFSYRLGKEPAKDLFNYEK